MNLGIRTFSLQTFGVSDVFGGAVVLTVSNTVTTGNFGKFQGLRV